jgi:glucose/arabinose dehydrogenase
MIKTIFFTLFITLFKSFSIDNQNVEDLNLQLDRLILPDGFKIEVYASDIENARSMAISPSGTIFVGNRRADNVFALKDTDGDNKVDTKYLITDKLKNMPNGVAYHKGDSNTCLIFFFFFFFFSKPQGP